MNTVITKEELEARNARFNALPREEQRKEIAKDVVAAIAAQKYKAKKGNYLRVVKNDLYVDGITVKAPQEYLCQDEVTCEVCAMGAMLMSRIRLGNNVESLDLYGVGGYTITDLMKDFFTEYELRLMETAFEGSTHGAGDHLIDEGTEEKAFEFFKRYDNNPAGRLLGLMYGIINTGDVTFDTRYTQEVITPERSRSFGTRFMNWVRSIFSN